jgi:hypothetical protein
VPVKLFLAAGNIKDIETHCAVGIEQFPIDWAAAKGAKA